MAKSVTPRQIQELAQEILSAGFYDGDEFTISEELHKIWADFLRSFEKDGYDLGLTAHDMGEYLKGPLAECFALGAKQHLLNKLTDKLEGLEVSHSDDLLEEVDRLMVRGIADFFKSSDEYEDGELVDKKQSYGQIVYSLRFKDSMTLGPDYELNQYHFKDCDNFLTDVIDLYEGFEVKVEPGQNKKGEMKVTLYWH